MEDWHNVPVFGARPERDVCLIRPSAYALITNDDERLAVVHHGAIISGGGIEAGESPEDAIVREAREECGLILRVDAWRIRAVQFVYSEPEQTHFEKRSTFIECVVIGPGVTILEKDHELVWHKPEWAINKLSNESQRWAVKCWTDQKLALK